MPDKVRKLIAALERGELESRLFEAATRMGLDQLGDQEVRHLLRILTSPALVVTSVPELLRFADLVDAHFLPRALRALDAGDLDDEACLRALDVPDHVRTLGDKCLFESGVAASSGPRGVDLEVLGARSYLRAAEIMETLSEDPRLRAFYAQNPVDAMSIDEEIAFLTRCGDTFREHARLLRALLHRPSAGRLVGQPRRADAAPERRDEAPEPAAVPTRAADGPRPEHDDDAAATATSAGAALVPRPAVRRRQPRRRGDDEGEAKDGLGNLRLVAKTEEELREERVRELIAAERTVLFSALDTERLRDELKRVVIHQEGAIDSLCDELCLYSMGTQDPRKPASYFLIGPTGVGKNYLVESTCRLFEELWGIEVPYLELEGPEFTYPSDINELKGAARGFIRSDEEGILSQFHSRAHDKPFSVILVDEVEKAHPQLRRFFLPIMDRGTMMDNRGRVLRFTNTTIFFTSNIGYSDAAASATPIGYGDEAARERSVRSFVESRVKKTLSPEFLNRVHLIHFEHLTQAGIEEIFQLELEKIRERYWSAQGLELEVTEAARKELLRRGYDRDYGARNLAKVLNRWVNIEVSKSLKRDESREFEDVTAVLAHIREMREGKVAMDMEEVRGEVARASRVQVACRRVRVDFREGEFAYEKD